MKAGWSHFIGFEDRSEIILMTIEAKEFVNLTRRYEEGTASEFQKQLLERRAIPFRQFFEMFMPLLPEINQRNVEVVLRLVHDKEYNKIEDEHRDALNQMEKTLERFISNLTASQSEDIALLKAMR